MMQSTLFKPSSMPWQPHAYQKRAVKFLLEHAASALFLDPGLGKTSIALAAIKFLLKRKMLERVLLVAPLRVCHSVWPNEVEKWDDFHGLRVVVLHGSKKDELLKQDADIYVVNPEGLDWLLDVTKVRSPSTGKVSVSIDMKRWKAFGFDTLIIDELSKFKHIQTIRFKALKLVLHTFQRRWGLTGSPASNGLLDLFGQCFVLDLGRSLGPYITHYRLKYFLPGHDGFSWNLREGADQEIYERLAPLALRMSAEDYLEMPTLIQNRIEVELPPEARKIYDAMEDDLIACMDEGTVVAKNSAIASMKCRQVASGGIYLDQDVQALVKLPKSKREWVNLHDVKTDALEDLVDELQGSPLLVAYDFGHELDRLRKRFPKAVYACDYDMKKFPELEKRWNAGKIPLLFGHPQSIAHGLNLQEEGHHVAWHTLTWDYELYDQFIRRVRRQGNKSKKVFVHHIMAKDTVDDVVLGALKAKGRGQNALFAALQKLRAQRRHRN